MGTHIINPKGQAGDRYCIDGITDIWPGKKFVFESSDGNTYVGQGLVDDEAKLVAAIHFGITI